MTKNNDATVTINTDFKGWKAVKDDALRVIRTTGSYDRLLKAHPEMTLENVQAFAKAFAAAALEIDIAEFTAPNGSDNKRVKDRFGTSLRDAIARRDGETEKDDAIKPVVLRATLSGEGGGSVTIPADHALYAEIVKLIGAKKA